MLFKETNLGTIHYRLPNSAEVPRVLGWCKINSKRLNDKEWMEENEMFIMADLIKHLHHFITEFEITYQDKKVTDKAELNEIRELRATIYEIAKEVMESLSPLEEKKKDS